MDVLLCPYCDDVELEITSSGEPEFSSDCYIPLYATCPDCGRKFKALEVFTFVGYEELEET